MTKGYCFLLFYLFADTKDVCLLGYAKQSYFLQRKKATLEVKSLHRKRLFGKHFTCGSTAIKKTLYV